MEPCQLVIYTRSAGVVDVFPHIFRLYHNKNNVLREMNMTCYSGPEVLDKKGNRVIQKIHVVMCNIHET